MKYDIIKIKRNCNLCNKEYEYDSRQKSKYCSSKCAHFIYRQNKIDGVLNIDYVECKICNFKFKEINADHLYYFHNMTSDEYDKIYGNNRTCENTKNNKDTLTTRLTPELSKKLSLSHTLEGYIKKYGEEKGTIKYYKVNEKHKISNSSQYYINLYGEIEGNIIFNDISKKKAITLQNSIAKHGKKIGKIKYNNWKQLQKIKNTLSHFITLYGEELVTL